MAGRRIGRLIAATAALSLLGGCAPSGAVPTTSVTAASTAVAQPTVTAVASPSTTASPTPAVTSTNDLTYGASGALTQPELLDVYAPTKPGPWPVVVMFHGDPRAVSKRSYAVQASRVAEQGFVVFLPSWGHLVGGTPTSVPTPAQFKAYSAEGACAVAFARSHATEFGGDPAAVILFGHSAGANLAGSIAFTHPIPTPGCPGGTSLGPIDALVTWDGDWTLTDPGWDGPLAADPSSWGTSTPITHIAADKTLRVVMLMSDVVGPFQRDLSDPKALDAFFTVRDASGTFRRELEAIGALKDKTYDMKEIQQLLYSLLKASGNPVTLTALPGASHESFGPAMGEEAMAAFAAAFKEAAGR